MLSRSVPGKKAMMPSRMRLFLNKPWPEKYLLFCEKVPSGTFSLAWEIVKKTTAAGKGDGCFLSFLLFDVEYDGTVLPDDDSAFKMGLHRFGQHPSFDIFPHIPETIRGQFVIDPNYVLLNDRTLVQIFAGIVGCSPDHLHPTLIGFQIGIGSLESRKEPMVDIDDLSLVGTGEVTGEYLHIPSEYHQINVKTGKEGPDFLFLGLLGLSSDRKIIERNPELVGNEFQVGVVGDDKGYLAVKVAFIVSGYQIIETVACLAYHDGNPGLVVTVAAFPLQVILLCKCGKILLQFLSRCFQIFHVQFNAHEIPTFGVVRMLLAMQDIVGTGVKPGCGRGKDPFAVFALYKENDFFLFVCH
jgi:hypothetical protein